MTKMENQKDLKETKQRRHPRDKANCLSNIFFCWTIPTFIKGLKKELVEDDLYGPLNVHESKILGDKLEEKWNLEKKKRKNPSLARAIWNVFTLEICIYGVILFVIEIIVKLTHPLCLGKIMTYYTPGQTEITKNEAYMYASFIVLASFLNVVLGHSYMLGNQHLGMKIRVACCSLIYRKSLRLSKTSLNYTTVGQIVNLLSNDVNRFNEMLKHFHNFWVAPIQIAVITYFLYTMIGPIALSGIAFFVLFIPLQMFLGKLSSKYRHKIALKTDERVRIMDEIICGIQVIKMYAWEKPFAKLVEHIRKLEVKQIRSTSILRAFHNSFSIFMNRTAIFFAIIAYVLLGNRLNAYYVFVVTSFYNVIRQSMVVHMPQALAAIAEALVSIKRLQKFLNFEEINYEISGGTKIHTPGVYMNGVDAKWDLSLEENTLTCIDFNVTKNELVAVIGAIGSGKTSLLHVILKELPVLKGSLDVCGRISYASQEPWIFTGSVRQNILFGETLDTQRYQEVCKVCALEKDLRQFPYGDKSIVGERGAMLSGGQKARINLARAIYKDADIYLLDDPLSAVDTYVGKQLFEECILKFLKGKCVILITHQVQYLGKVDKIFLLHKGCIEKIGTYEELLESFDDFRKEHIKEEFTDRKQSINEIKENSQDPEEIKEHKSSGSVTAKVYKSYIKAGGRYMKSIALISLFVVAQIMGSFTDYFTTLWVNLEQSKENSTENQNFAYSEKSYILRWFDLSQNCIYFYSCLICILIFITISRSIFFMMFCMDASENLHNNMFSNMVYTTMRFFNTNPSGRILNRFSKDIGAIDEILPSIILDTVQIGLTVVSITVVVATVNPWILLPTLIILVIFYWLKIVFLASSRNIKRMEGTTRSPVFSHISASLQGLTTIRAFDAQQNLIKEFDQHQNLHSSAFYMFIACNRAFGMWLDLHCVTYIAFVTLSFLFMDTELFGGNVGLAITQSLSLTGMFQWGMRQWSELENQMTSVERVVEYTELKPEIDNNTKNPPPSWPQQGRIEFQSLSLRYSALEPFVLKNLSFTVSPKEKIGIVGRTGAGKTSLISALFRLAEIEGTVWLDEVDTKSVPLQTLRSKISIIPQEPVLFSGTLRKNLDPFDQYKETDLWRAIEEVELKNVIQDLPSGLDSRMSERGSNFSVGQRQLFCLARAIIRNNKIIILDEATANVDPQTDELIQNTIRMKFTECTVLTIAHRLQTIMDSDKVLVMDGGEVAEFDSPCKLLENENGIFYGLVSQTGKAMAENLTHIAQQV